MTWLPDVDAARAYLSNGQTKKDKADEPVVSRKVVYGMVAAGLTVVRLGDSEPHEDKNGRLRRGRLMFRTEWIDQFLEGRASRADT